MSDRSLRLTPSRLLVSALAASQTRTTTKEPESLVLPLHHEAVRAEKVVTLKLNQ